MSETDSRIDGACNAIERLVDDPETRITVLEEARPPDDDVSRQVSVFKALANEDRLRLLAALRESERCVCELQVVLDAPQSTVGTHLRKLRDAGLVKSRKKGRWTLYRVSDTAVFEVLDLGLSIGEA